jgi:hypothetical protein
LEAPGFQDDEGRVPLPDELREPAEPISKDEREYLALKECEQGFIWLKKEARKGATYGGHSQLIPREFHASGPTQPRKAVQCNNNPWSCILEHMSALKNRAWGIDRRRFPRLDKVDFETRTMDYPITSKILSPYFKNLIVFYGIASHSESSAPQKLYTDDGVTSLVMDGAS